MIFVLLSQMKVRAQLPMAALAFYFNLTTPIFREKNCFQFLVLSNGSRLVGGWCLLKVIKLSTKSIPLLPGIEPV